MRACKINRCNGEFISWINKGVRYALIKKANGQIVDQNGREIVEKLAKKAIEAAMA